MLNGKKHPIAALVLLPMAMLATGCSLMHDDLDPCAVKPETHTSVKFVYDYNTADQDLFADNVGAVRVYVFDTNDRLVTIEERTNSTNDGALSKDGFQIDFSSDVVVPGNTYRFYAVGHGNPGGYDHVVSDPGAWFDLPDLQPGTHGLADFVLTLGRDGSGYVDHQNVGLDPLWLSREGVELVIPEEKVPAEGDPQEEDHYLQATLPLMRITNHVSVTFWQTDFPTYINPADYEIRLEVPEGNGRLDATGNLLADGQLLHSPYSVTTGNVDTDKGKAAAITAHFGVSRLMANDNMTLVVTNRITGNVTRISGLSSKLAVGREAFADKGWSAQEYLDREYEYAISFPFGDPIPKWIDVRVAILSWTKRIQNVEL